MTGQSAAATAVSFALVDPAPNHPVIPADRLRPAFDPNAVSRFGDDQWDLSPMDHKQTSEAKNAHWSTFPASFRESMKRIAWTVINRQTPEVLLSRARTTSRPLIAAQTFLHAWKAWRDLTHWLVEHEIASLDEVESTVLEEYARTIRARGRSFGHDRNTLFALTRIWAYAPFLLPQDRLCMPPWDDPGSELTDFLGERNDPGGENTTAVIHPATMAPLLVWALRMVTDLAPDVLGAWRERNRLLGNIPTKSERGASGRLSQHRLREYFEDLREHGKPVPLYAGYLAPSLTKVAATRGSSRPGVIAATFIGGVLGVTNTQVNTFLKRFPEVLDGQQFGEGAPLELPVTARIDGRLWTDNIDFADVRELAVQLSTAALVVIAYLSGMRPEEVLHLERGCASREERADGTVRYQIRGRHFKGVTDERGSTIPEGEVRSEPWTVIELVHRAVKVVEELADGPWLFARTLSRASRAATRHGQTLSTSSAKRRIVSFTAWANRLAALHGRDHELIPPDPDGLVTLTRFRRTVAWFIYRRPGGRIALGLQYGHVGASMGESYAGRSRFDMLKILDFEQVLVMADNLTAARERIADGEGISGPAAHRYVAASEEFQARFEGGFLTKRQHRALIANPRLRVFEHPNSLLTCNHDPFKALCDPEEEKGGTQQTPSFDRCDRACGNISRTDTHINRAMAEREAISAELADGLNPMPIARRLGQRSRTLEAIISEHEAARIIPMPRTKDDQ